jgi:hypothetical protein
MKKNGPQNIFILSFKLNFQQILKTSGVYSTFPIPLTAAHSTHILHTDRIEAMFDGIMSYTGIIQVFMYQLTVLKEAVTFNQIIF